MKALIVAVMIGCCLIMGSCTTSTTPTTQTTERIRTTTTFDYYQWKVVAKWKPENKVYYRFLVENTKTGERKEVKIWSKSEFIATEIGDYWVDK